MTVLLSLLNLYVTMTHKQTVTKILINSDESEPGPSTTVLDSSWVYSFQKTFCNVEFNIVGGNRDSVLDNTYDPTTRKASQLWQKKKYRYLC